MSLKYALGAGMALFTSLTAQAQNADPTRFATERDTLFQQAATIRSQTDAQIKYFKTSFLAIRGTRRCTKSHMTFTPAVLPIERTAKVPHALAKKHIVKFKRVGTLVEKVYYYTPQRSIALTEYYQDGKLIRLKVENTAGVSEYLRGDYIVKTARKGSSQQGRKSAEYFVAPRPQS